MPEEPRGHGEVAQRLTENVSARERARAADERFIAAAAAAIALRDDFPSVEDAIVLAGDHVATRLSDARGADAGARRAGRAGRGARGAAALAVVDASSRAESFFALRAALCSSRAEMIAFADAFTVVFGSDAPADPLDDLGELAKQALPRVAVPPQGEQTQAAELTPAPAAWSEEELLREKDFAAYTDAERRVARQLLARIALKGPMRRSRRTVPTARRRDEHDLRATIRVSLRHGGELLERRYRDQAVRPRRLVLICDVSGSMAPYSRMLLQYMQACVAARARVEAFVFGTRLTRVTRELRGRDSDRALARAAAAVDDWSGGTRIGEAIAELNRVHGRRIGRGSLVILLSDGWDRGEPEELAEEMARLKRTAHRVIWLNPLAADPRYEPLTRGHEGRDALRRPAAPGQLDRLARDARRPDGRGHRVSAGLILAAGGGRRFGGRKQLADLHGRPLLEHAIEHMLAVAALDRVVVVLGHAADEIRASVRFGAAEVVINEEWERGQATSLRRGIAALGRRRQRRRDPRRPAVHRPRADLRGAGAAHARLRRRARVLRRQARSPGGVQPRGDGRRAEHRRRQGRPRAAGELPRPQVGRIASSATRPTWTPAEELSAL